MVGSKKKSIAQQKFKINKDQKRPKLRINVTFVWLTKHKKKAPARGHNIRENNIKIKFMKNSLSGELSDFQGLSNKINYIILIP
jgi:hypothetical protein